MKNIGRMATGIFLAGALTLTGCGDGSSKNQESEYQGAIGYPKARTEAFERDSEIYLENIEELKKQAEFYVDLSHVLEEAELRSIRERKEYEDKTDTLIDEMATW